VVDVDGMAKNAAPLANGIEIKPGKTIELKPGALRIVLLGLKEPFQLGQKIKGTLVFEKAGPVEIVYNVEENPRRPPSVASRVHSTSITRRWLRGLCPGLVLETHHSPAGILTSVQFEPNVSGHRKPACHHHRNKNERRGRSWPRWCAYHFSASDWHTAPARCCPHGHLIAAS